MGKANTSKEPRSIKVYRSFIVVALVISGAIFLVSGGIFISRGLSYSWEIGGPESFGYFGSFVGGVLGPAVAASSLLLILKTLKVQMDEMAQTNESLSLSAELNRASIEQQRNNFIMSWSLQRLSESNLNALRNVEFNYTEQFRFLNSEPKEEIRSCKVCDFISATYEDRKKIVPINGTEVEEYLKRLVYLAIDTLDYIQSGGHFHYKKDEIAELITLLEPFRNPTSSLAEIIDALDLERYLGPLASGYKRIVSITAEKDAQTLSRL